METKKEIKANCSKCGIPTEEGSYCGNCLTYMPSGDDLAEESITNIEHRTEEIIREQYEGDSE